MSHFRNFLRASSLLVAFTVGTSAQAGRLEWKFGLDSFTREQTPVTGLHQLTLGYVTDSNYFIGQSLYSGALGAGGGLFVGGIEVGRYFDLGSDYRLALGAYVGGGGGGGRINGDGVMIKPFGALEIPFAQGHLGIGGSWVSIDGSDISTPAITTYFSKNLDLSYSSGQTWSAPSPARTRFSEATVRYTTYTHGPNSRNLAGNHSQDMTLLGAEFVFDSGTKFDTYMQANGVVSGYAEGYADWILGVRSKDILGLPFLYYDIGLGAGSGGGIDVGGGFLWSLGVGAQIDLSDNLKLRAGLQKRQSFSGAFSVTSRSVDISYAIGQKTASPQTPGRKMHFYTGVTQQFPNDTFFKNRSGYSDHPNLLETSVDVFLTDQLYLTGQASTAFTGDVGGYQLGLFGVGWNSAVHNDLSVSLELLAGAAGGAGVDTKGGLIAGARAELDYWLSSDFALSVGVGQVRAVQSNGMAPVTANFGIKVPVWF